MSGLARQIRAAERPNTECTAEEWHVRCELAALYRLFDHYGMTDLIYTHISARVPGEPEHYLINPYGLLFNEITASNLIKVNYAGEVVAGDYPYNEAGHLIHSAVLKARPDINYALHSHTRAGIAVSAMKGGLQPLSQHALLLLGTIAYHSYGALFAEEEECARMAQDLGDKYLLVMENHGLLSVGRTAAEAFQYLYYLEMSCKVQVDILQSGQEPIIPPADAIADLSQRGAPGEEPWGAETWPALLRLLDRKDPSYKN